MNSDLEQFIASFDPKVSLNETIDHTILKPDATPAQVKKICDEALQYQFKTVCVNTCHIEEVAKQLGTQVLPICVVGFPLGACLTDVKVYESKRAIELGAKEIDMVINVGWLKAGLYDRVYEDIRAVVEACGSIPVKVIIEICLFNKTEILTACYLSKKANAAFVKTSTGFSSGGATAEAVQLMRAAVGPGMGVKASGGIRTRENAIAMIDAGANRIGASASIDIVKN